MEEILEKRKKRRGRLYVADVFKSVPIEYVYIYMFTIAICWGMIPFSQLAILRRSTACRA